MKEIWIYRMEKNSKYDLICILFLCLIVPLIFMILFNEMYNQKAYIVLPSISLFFWVILAGNRTFKCNTAFCTIITILYIILISMAVFTNYPVDNMFYGIMLYFLFFTVIYFILYNLWKSNNE